MSTLRSRFEYLFTSTKGLILLAVGILGLIVAIWGTLSGPMVEWGVRDITVQLLGMDLKEVEREGRLVVLYHTIAFTVIAIMVYMITAFFKMPQAQRATVNATITVGYLTAMFGGIGFAYFGHNWVMHGIYLLGMAIIAWAAILLIIALNPFRPEYHVTDKERAHFKSGVDRERFAFWVLAIVTLGSAIFGAVPGMYYGNGFETFLAENTIREPYKTLNQKSIIGHLHIMLALIGMGTSLIIGRWLNQRGWSHKLGMPLMVSGMIITAVGAWSVIFTPYAHYIIYVGATFGMTSALFLVIYGFIHLPKQRLAEQGITKHTTRQWWAALLHDPLKFGPLWQMIFFNFTVSGVGIFMAVKLSEIFRVWPHREERIVLTGHWHTLATLIATILLMYFADQAGLKGRIRQWFGWILIIFSDLAFAGVWIFEMKRLFVSEYNQQPIVNTSMIMTDIGLGTVEILLAAFLIWRLADLFKRRGRWSTELAAEREAMEVSGR